MLISNIVYILISHLTPKLHQTITEDGSPPTSTISLSSNLSISRTLAHFLSESDIAGLEDSESERRVTISDSELSTPIVEIPRNEKLKSVYRRVLERVADGDGLEIFKGKVRELKGMFFLPPSNT